MLLSETTQVSVNSPFNLMSLTMNMATIKNVFSFTVVVTSQIFVASYLGDVPLINTVENTPEADLGKVSDDSLLLAKWEAVETDVAKASTTTATPRAVQRPTAWTAWKPTITTTRWGR